MGVGLNSSGDKVSTCWELHVVLQKEVRLLVGLWEREVTDPWGSRGRDIGWA